MREISLSPETPHQETTPEKQIRVAGAYGGYSQIPHDITKRANRELPGACSKVFSFVWERTVAFRKSEREIPFPEFVGHVNYGERSIREAIRWLDRNGWLSVRKNGSRPSIYGIAMQLLQDTGCLDDLPADSGKSPSVSPVAKIATLNSPPHDPPLKDLKSLKKNTHSTPVLDTTGNGPGPEPEEGYRGYFDSQPKIPDDPVAEELKYCGVYPRTIVKLMDEFEPENILSVVENYKRDMKERHNVRDFAKVLVWRIRNGITTWDVDSWVSDVQREFDDSIGSDKSRLLGILAYAGLEQKLDVGEVLSKLDVQGISYDDLAKWAAVDVRVQP